MLIKMRRNAELTVCGRPSATSNGNLCIFTFTCCFLFIILATHRAEAYQNVIFRRLHLHYTNRGKAAGSSSDKTTRAELRFDQDWLLVFAVRMFCASDFSLSLMIWKCVGKKKKLSIPSTSFLASYTSVWFPLLRYLLFAWWPSSSLFHRHVNEEKRRKCWLLSIKNLVLHHLSYLMMTSPSSNATLLKSWGKRGCREIRKESLALSVLTATQNQFQFGIPNEIRIIKEMCAVQLTQSHKSPFLFVYRKLFESWVDVRHASYIFIEQTYFK